MPRTKVSERHCWICKEAHDPPTGSFCTKNKEFVRGESDFTGGGSHLDPNGTPSSRDWNSGWIERFVDLTFDNLRPPKANSAPADQNFIKFSVEGRYDPIKEEPDQFSPVGQGNEAVPDSIQDEALEPALEMELKSQVATLQNELSRLSLDAKSSNDKLARIENLLLNGPSRSKSKSRKSEVNTDIRAGEDQGRRSGTSHHDATPQADGDITSPSTTSPYGSDSTSSDSDKGAAKHRGPKKGKKSSEKRRYMLSRFLPHDERSKSLTTDKLWFCHGSLMLDLYTQGWDIEGLLRHNVFIAEKTASRCYLSSGICKYDEAVREKAKSEGMIAYTGGDMDLAMRFLSTEYTRPKTTTNIPSYQNSKTGFARKGQVPIQTKDGKITKNICWAFNSAGCQFDMCKYAHVCSRCASPSHSQHVCKSSQYGQSSPPFQPNPGA